MSLKAPTFYIYLTCLSVLALVSLFLLPHRIEGDAVTYVDAIHVLNGAPLTTVIGPTDYAVHRIMTTFIGLEIINILSFVFGSIPLAWLIWATFLYFLVNIVFYKLLLKMFGNHTTACFGGLFFAANYAMFVFGPTFFMDIGGWFFYTLSIYLLYTYIQSGKKKDLLASALAISVGAFFKENALVAYVPFFFVVLYENYRLPLTFFKKIIPLSLIIFVPIMVHQVCIYWVFGETYLRWIEINHSVYVYANIWAEYLKSLGSLLNLLIPVSLVGVYYFAKAVKSKAIDTKRVLFIAAVLISSIPALMWPGITQRVLFMVVPGLVILASFAIDRYRKYWYVFAVLLVVYALSSFYMDSFILNFVELPF